MFPFQQCNELSEDEIFSLLRQQETYLRDSIPASVLEGSDLPKNMEKSPRKNVLLATPGGGTDDNSPGGDRRMLRRDMERQRRQEMATLNESLRSLVPTDYIKVNKIFLLPPFLVNRFEHL